MRILSFIEIAIYFFGFAFGAYRGGQELYITMTESQPTTFDASDFAQKYDGQRWIRVRGVPLIDHSHQRLSNHNMHRGKGLYYVTVPIVSAQWQPGEPIHVLATVGPKRMTEVRAWAASMQVGGPQVSEGQLRPSGFRDPPSMFPNLSIGEPLVVINEGTQPNHVGGMIAFFGLMLVAAWMMFSRLRRLAEPNKGGR